MPTIATDDEPTFSTVYRYGLRAPLDWGPDCERQLDQMRELWNVLVGIEREHRVAVREIAVEDTTTAEAKREYDAICAKCDALWAEIKQRRAKTRSKAKADTEDMNEALRVARTRRKEVAATLKAATKAAYNRSRPRLAALEIDRRANVKAARQAAAGAGLWWGNYNAIIASYDVARNRAMKEGAELREQSPGPRGRLVNQIIGGITPDALDDGAHNQVWLGPQHGGRPNPRFRTLIVTVYTDRDAEGKHRRRTVTWPIFLDRPLPAAARIQQIEIHRDYRAHCWHWHATFLLRMPDTRMPPTGPRVAVNLGWRQLTTGVRVGTVLRDGDREPQHVMLPARVLALAEQADREQQERDDDCNHMLYRLRAIDATAVPGPMVEELAALRARQSPRSRDLARLVLAWRQQQGWQPEPLAEYEQWMRDDARLWHHVTNVRRRINNVRKDWYRCEVKRLFADASEIVINGHDMSETARAEESDLPAPVRAMRFLAAPSELRTAITDYARRIGIPLRVLDIPHDRCARCDTLYAATVPDRSVIVWRCPRGHVSDQDHNYCRLLLACERPDDAQVAGVARSAENGGESVASAMPRWQRLKEAKRWKAAGENRSKPDSQPVAMAAKNE